LAQVLPSTMRRARTGDNGSKASAEAAALEKQRQEDEIIAACRALFDAYDVDESGELDRQEFVQIEMRLAFSKGNEVREAPLTAKYTLADRDNSGCISFEEFREQQMRNFLEEQLSRQEILTLLSDETRACILERQRMGPRYHAGIRAELRRIFQLYDTSGDAALSPEEWIAAQKIVAQELSDDLDDAWIDEAAFKTADTNGDGVLSEAEYLEASFSMFEVTRLNMAQLMTMLKNITTALESKLGNTTTQALTIYMQDKAPPDFLPPSRAWQDEPTSSATSDPVGWKNVGEIKFSTNLSTVDEVISLARLSCDISKETWLSIFYIAPNPEGNPLVTILRDSNTKAALDFLSKQNAVTRLYIKNVRARPKKLTKRNLAYLEDRESLLAKKTGNSWGVDWETQLVGAGSKYPRAGEVPIAVGDAVVIEIPTTDDNCQFNYVPSIYMDGIEVVSQPVEETIEPKVKKKKKPKKGAVVEEEKPPDLLKQLSFVGLQEGKCVMFVDISWEDQEMGLCNTHSLGAPVKENTIARIGPIEIDVQKPVPGAPKEKTFMWWNGDKWTAKKGPAKKKGKK